MNTEFKYILQPYTGLKSRTTCPACQKKNQFALYINQLTKEPLAENVGRCNREINCGNHYTPKQYFEDNKGLSIGQQPRPKTQALPKPEPKPLAASFIPFEVMKRTRKMYDQNNFAKFLIGKLGQEKALELLTLYHVGTSKNWQGATIFWQIDSLGKIRTGKVMLYNEATGHRVKEPYPHITWVHKLANLQGYQLNQCLFGEHLLSEHPEKPVSIVESEKTAILAAAYLPEYNWLAAGNLNNLIRERCQALKNRNVLLWPDAGAFQKWQSKAESLKDLARFFVLDLVERNATPDQLKQGFDIADYLEGQPETMFTGRNEFEQTPDINILEEVGQQEVGLPIQTKAPELHLEEEPQKDQGASEIIFEEESQKQVALPDQLSHLQKSLEAEIQTRKLSKEELQQSTTSESWPIEELETFFASVSLPEAPVRLNVCTVINDPRLFIQTHLATVKANNGKARFKPYLKRLIEFKETFIRTLNPT